MKKVQQFLKSNIRLIIGVIIGCLISISYVCASNEILDSNQIDYSNTNSTLISTDIQSAISELDEKANSDDYSINKYLELSGTPTNYIYGSEPPTIESPTTPPSNKYVYIGLYEDGQYGICIKIGGRQECFRYGNWIFEAKHLIKVFGEQKCETTSVNVVCHDANFNCTVHSNGKISCLNNDTLAMCGFTDVNTPTCT